MASNKQKTQQRRWIPRNEGAIASRTPNSEFIMKGEKSQMLELLKDMFQDVIELEVIHSVAESCNYNRQASVEALMMISNDEDIRKNSEYCTNFASNSHNRRICVPELPMQAPVKTRNVLSREIRVPELPMQAKSKKEKILSKRAAFLTSNVSSTSNRASSPGLGAIKVTYRNPNNYEESDSDADVVIEEEKECEMSTGNTAYSMLNIPYQLTPQFVTPVQLQEHSQNRSSLKTKTSVPSMKAAVTKLPTIRLPNTAMDALNPSTISSAHLLPQKPVKVLTITERVQKNINDGTRVMVLMRGAPGSGKSFLAKRIIEHTMGKKADHSKYIFSTDDFFVLLGRFIPNMLSEAHNWNRERVHAAVERKLNPIIVDNTNTEVWEMKPYAVLAVQHGYILELLEPSTPWRYMETQLVHKNIHKVPQQQIHNMLARFEKNLTGAKLIAMLRLKYSPANKPPQPAANSPSKLNAKSKKKQPHPVATVLGTVDPAMSVSTKPKRTRTRRHFRKVVQTDQVPKHTGTQKSDIPQHNETKKMMDSLALFLAEQYVEKNSNLDSAGASSLPKNETFVKDIFLSNKENVPEITFPNQAQDVSHMWRNKEPVLSEENTINIESCVQIQNSSISEGEKGDGSDDDDDVENEEENDDSDDDDTEQEEDEMDSSLAKMPEWIVSDEEWEYQSDKSEESDIKISKQTELSESSQQCLEYILITDDSKWIYQKDHLEEKQENSQDLLIDLSNEIVTNIISEDSLLLNANTLGDDISKFENLLSADKVDSKQFDMPDNFLSAEESSAVQKTRELFADIEVDTTKTDALKNSFEADIAEQTNSEDYTNQFSATDFINEFVCHKIGNSEQDKLNQRDHQIHVANTVEVCPKVKATILNAANSLQSEGEISPITISLEELNQWLCNLEPSLHDAQHQAGSEQEQTVSQNLSSCSLNSEDDIREFATQIQNIPAISVDTSKLSEIGIDNDIKNINAEGKELGNKSDGLTEYAEVESDVQKTETVAKPESESAELQTAIENETELLSDLKQPHLNSALLEYKTESGLLKLESASSTIIDRCDESSDNAYIKNLDTASMVIKYKQVSSSELTKDTSNSESMPFEQSDLKCSQTPDDKHFSQACSTMIECDRIIEEVVSDVDNSAFQLGKVISYCTSAMNIAGGESQKIVDMSVCQPDEQLQKYEYSSLVRLDSETSSGTSILNEIAHLQKLEDMPVLQLENETTASISELNIGIKTEKPRDNSLLQIDNEIAAFGHTLTPKQSDEMSGSSMIVSVVTESEKSQDTSLQQQNNETSVEIKVFPEIVSESQQVSSILLNVTETQEQDLDTAHQQVTDEDDFQSAVSSEASGKGEGEQKLEEAVMTTSAQSLPTYDLLSWVLKCSEEEVATDEWDQGSMKDVEKSENLLEPRPAREQRTPRKNVRSFRQIPGKKELEEYMSPECANWATVAEPDVTWERSTKTENTIEDTHKKWDGPQPQRSLFSSAQISTAARLLTPDDFINLRKPKTENICEFSGKNQLEQKIDNSSNTSYQDFALLSNLNKNGDAVESVDVKILSAHSLNINDDTVSFKSVNKYIPFKLMLDKGSMTNDEDDIAMALLVSAKEMDAAKTQDLEQLEALFPDVSRDDLMEIFEKCNCNLNWTVDLLLESKLEQFEPILTAITKNELIKSEDIQKNEEAIPLEESISAPEAEVDETAKKLWQQEVKRYIEENIVLGDENYSEHTLRIKKLRHGEMMDMGEVTTKPTQNVPDNNQNILENTLGAIGSEQSEERAQALDEETESTNSSNFEEEEMIPAHLDIGFINQLHQRFGNPVPIHPEDIPPVVNLPLALARQIHFYVIESQLELLRKQETQLAQMMQEDEELARKLQEQEHSASNKVPDLQEIMDMEIALELCRSYQDEEKVSKEDLATKMKKQKLYEMFPNLDHEALLSLFASNDYSFDKTVGAVMACTGEDGESVKNVWAPEAFERLKAAIGQKKDGEEEEAVRTEQGTAVHRSLPLIVVNDPPELQSSLKSEDAIRVAEFYRSQSNTLRQRYSEFTQKSVEARNASVALWYKNVAIQHLNGINEANTKAAAMILRTNELKQDNATLDLHFLHVSEALHALDVFLDFHIANMNPAHFKKHLFLITGRGLHSKDGKSRLRPAVEKRLAQRNIRWWAENPGLLHVAITGSTAMSCTIKQVN